MRLLAEVKDGTKVTKLSVIKILEEILSGIKFFQLLRNKESIRSNGSNRGNRGNRSNGSNRGNVSNRGNGSNTSN